MRSENSTPIDTAKKSFIAVAYTSMDEPSANGLLKPNVLFGITAWEVERGKRGA